MNRIAYICDPDRNIECSKEWCHRHGGKCRHTENIEYAKNFDSMSAKASRVVYYMERIDEDDRD